MVVLETERLIISEFTTDDAAFFLQLVNSPGWIQYIGDRKIYTEVKAIETIKNQHLKSYKTYGFGFYKMLLKSDNLKPIGTCGLVKRDQLKHVDIGFALLPDYKGKGLAFEASKAVMKLAKDQFKIKRLVAITLPENKSSINLLKKLGMIYEKTIKPFDDDTELQLFAKTLD